MPMRRMTYPSADPYPCSVATIGFFDGVHVGHRCLINQVRQCAAVRGLFSLLITFDAHPRSVLQPDNRMQLLSTPEEKYTLLSDTGADGLLVLPFTRELSSLSAKEFMQEVLYKQLNVRVLVIGYDHRFGRGRAATFGDYEAYGREIGMEVVQAEAYMGDGRPVSSSFVRSLLAEGNVEAAAQCLSYGYSLSGTVVSGFRVGHKIGYPTANLQVDDDRKQIPGRGVYAVRVWMDEQQSVPYGGMLNVGFRPTLDNGSQTSIEVNIFDFIGDLYGKRLKVEFVSRLRPEHRFDNLQALQQQLAEDEVRARRLLSHV
ncbi:MAG: bifunctional riboflavin kinase/FAD synthetase [Paraprevotella sp.]|nr:bifunctional riboflavin kinase/FAD synthetase [Paraprevotella sp.]